MPVPVPRQRKGPPAESGQAAPATPQDSSSAPTAPDPSDAAGAPDTSAAPGSPDASDTLTTQGIIVGALTLLVIEDHPERSLSVPELLDAAGNRIRVRTARNLTEAKRLLTDDVHCILLDLAMRPHRRTPASGTGGGTDLTAAPADELAILKEVLRLAPRHAVLALTEAGDTETGAQAVRVGAQDYLLREEVDARLLSRAIRYAVARKRADAAQQQLTESRLRAEENARLERGLLPTPLLSDSALRFSARYRPGRSRALLGGDFYDTVQTPDGTVHAMIGDVCGHGPDEAALGVELRIAWRALTLAGLSGNVVLATLQQVLEHERADDEIFATLCTVDIAPDGRRIGYFLAGHPAPLLAPHTGSAGSRAPEADLLAHEDNGPALGLLPDAHWPRQEMALPPSWSLMLYTDGLIEGRVGGGTQRLGQEGMLEIVRRALASGLSGDELLGAALNEARELNGDELADDVALLLLAREE